MNQLMLPRSAPEAVAQDRATAREVLLMHASALISRQVKEQFWIWTGSAGIVVLAISEVWHLALQMGYLNGRALPAIDLIGASQALALLVFLFTTAAFVAGRLRMIRSEIDLLRLKIEMLSQDMAEEVALAKPEKQGEPTRRVVSGRVKAPRRRINLRSPD